MATTAELIGTAVGCTTDTKNLTTGAINTIGANLLVMIVPCNAGPTTVSDSAGNTWTGLTQRGTGTSDPSIRIYYCYNPTTSTTHTFSSALGTANYASMIVFAFSGALGSPFDQEAGTVVTSAHSVQPGSITPSGSGYLYVAGIGYQGQFSFIRQVGAAETVNIATFLSRSPVVPLSGSVHYALVGYWGFLKTAAAFNPLFISDGNNCNLSIAAATFKF